MVSGKCNGGKKTPRILSFTGIPQFSAETSTRSCSGHDNEKETEMMSVRWKIFALSYQIPQEDQKEILACPICFRRKRDENANWIDVTFPT